MKTFIAALLCSTMVAVLAASRTRRAAYDLPAGVELIVGGVRTSFQCQSDGYYADVDNDCLIFHVCHTTQHADGTNEMQQWSFMCGNQTVFDQLSFTCTYPEDAVPCGAARDFLYLNANLGAGPNVPFHTDQDIARAEAVKPGRASQPVYQPPRQPARQPQPNRPYRG